MMSTKPLRPLRIAALLGIATLAIGAAAKLGGGQAGASVGGATAALTREFRAAGSGPVRFSGALEGTAVLPDRDRDVRMELVIGADAARGVAPRVATDLVVVLDHSGSMSGDKIVQARAAVRTLISALGDGDRFALVTYSDYAQTRIPLGALRDRGSWYESVDSIVPEGGTNMSSGLDAAFAMIDVARTSGRTPRVVLISDGLANQGDASREGLVGRAARAARGEYALSTVGVGADFDEGLMAALADAGTGNFHFLADASGLDRILSAEFATARENVASGLRVAIEPASGVAVVDAAGYPLTRDGSAVRFQPGDLFAGQERRIWVTLRVPAGAAGDVPLGRFALEYGAGGERHRLAFAETPHVAAVADESAYFASLDAEELGARRRRRPVQRAAPLGGRGRQGRPRARRRRRDPEVPHGSRREERQGAVEGGREAARRRGEARRARAAGRQRRRPDGPDGGQAPARARLRRRPPGQPQ